MISELGQISHLRLQQTDTVLDSSADMTETLHNFILCRLPKPGTALASAARHHFVKPGKMLRAKMALRSANILNIDPTAALHWAVAIEVLHNASLIHDDICDGDQLRRGRLSVWSKYGRNVALTLGDWLVALSFELAAEAGQRSQTPSLVKILAQHMATTTAGEAAEFGIHTGLEWDRYLEIAADKTAPLLTAPLEGVAAMALHGNATAAIGSYFHSLGTAYQIANDILNFRALDGAADLGSDLARRSPNAVVVQYRQTLCTKRKVAFDDWCVSGCVVDLKIWQKNILQSDAMALTAHQMHSTLEQTALFAQALPVGLTDAISPVQALLTQVCMKSVAPVNC